MNRELILPQNAFAIVLMFALTVMASVSPVRASGRTKAAQEAAAYLLQRFGRQAAREGVETLARKIEIGATRHGDDFFEAVRKVGPRTFQLAEEAGLHGNQAVRAMALHGEHGATWIVGRPKGMQLYLQHGDDAAAALVKHKGIAEPVLEHLGQPAIKALQATSGQSGRRLAMMVESGDLAKIGRTDELLDVISRYGDRAMTFVWEHKGALATTAGLTAFLMNPEPFINGARDLAQVVGDTAVRPVAQVPAEIARSVNWTVIFLVAGGAALVFLVVKWFLRGGWSRWPRMLQMMTSVVQRDLLARTMRRLSR